MKDRKKLAEILAVEEDAGTRQIRRAFRRQAMLRHPDKCGGTPEAAEDFRRLREAYRELLRTAPDAPPPVMPAADPVWRSDEDTDKIRRPSPKRAGPARPIPRAEIPRWAWAVVLTVLCGAMLVLAQVGTSKPAKPLEADPYIYVPESANSSPEESPQQVAAAAPEPAQPPLSPPSLTGMAPSAAVLEKLTEVETALSNNNPDAALALLPSIFAEDPRSPDAHRLQGRAFILKQRFEAAVAEESLALAGNPRDAAAYYHRADAEHVLNNLNAAIADVGRAIELAPETDVGYYDLRGMIYLDLGIPATAMGDFQRAIRLLPDYADAHFNLGRAYSMLGEHLSAVKSFDRAIALETMRYDYYYERGFSHYHLRELEDAVADYSHSIALKGDFFRSYSNRGSVLRLLKRYDLALADFTKTAELAPNEPLPYLQRASVYLDKNELALALKDAEKSLSFQPNPYPADAFCRRGEVFTAMGSYDKAIADYNDGLQADPYNTDCLDDRGHTFEKQGKKELAAADLKASQELKAPLDQQRAARKPASAAAPPAPDQTTPNGGKTRRK